MKKLIKSTALTMMIMSAAGVSTMFESGAMELPSDAVAEVESLQKLVSGNLDLITRLQQGGDVTKEELLTMLQQQCSSLCQLISEKDTAPLTKELMNKIFESGLSRSEYTKRCEIFESLASKDVLWCYKISFLKGSITFGNDNLQYMDEVGNKAYWMSEVRVYENLDLDISSFAKYKELTLLMFVNPINKLKGNIECLKVLNKLKTLWLSDSQVSGDISALAELPDLNSLVLKGCKNITGNANVLLKLNKLWGLDLRGCSSLTIDDETKRALQEKLSNGYFAI
jgi:hypothetical protein